MSRRGDGAITNIGIIAQLCRGESRGDGAVNVGDLSDDAVNIGISRRCRCEPRGDGGVNIGDRTVNIGIIARQCRGESRGDGAVNIGDRGDGAVNISIFRSDVAAMSRTRGESQGDGAVNIGDRGDGAVNIARRCRGESRCRPILWVSRELVGVCHKILWREGGDLVGILCRPQDG